MKIINKRKFIARIMELLVLIVTIVLTPMSISYANTVRGYLAVGGEYLVFIFGLVIALVIETIYKENIKIEK